MSYIFPKNNLKEIEILLWIVMTPYCALYGLINFTGEMSFMFTAIILVSFHWKSLFYFKYILFHFHFCRNGSSRYVEVLIFYLMWLYVIKLICPSVAKRRRFNFKAFGGEMPSVIQIASTFTKHFLTNFLAD